MIGYEPGERVLVPGEGVGEAVGHPIPATLLLVQLDDGRAITVRERDVEPEPLAHETEQTESEIDSDGGHTWARGMGGATCE